MGGNAVKTQLCVSDLDSLLLLTKKPNVSAPWWPSSGLTKIPICVLYDTRVGVC
jgi:hypothetical protein